MRRLETLRGAGGSAFTHSRGLLAASTAAATLYAATLYFPPATASVAAAPPDASLLTRLFPGVPPWWMAARLLCAAAAVVLAAWAGAAAIAPSARSGGFDHGHGGHDGRGGHGGSGGRHEPHEPTAPWTWAALGAAALLAAMSWNVAPLGRRLQITFFVALGAPAALLALGARRAGRPSREAGARYGAPAVVTAALIATWLALRFFAGRHSPRAANLVDGWDGFDCLVKAARSEFNVLADACYTGYTALPLVLQGAGTLGHWLPLTFESVQVVHLAWVAAAAALSAWTAAQLFGRSAGPPAAAILLFAPMSLMTPLWPAGPFVFAVYAAALLTAAVRVERTGSTAALAAFGALAGIACRCPPLLALVPVLAAWALSSAHARARSSTAAYATATLTFCAAFVPSLPEWSNVAHALTTYGGSGGASWAAMEAALFGQFSPQAAQRAIGAPTGHPLDVPAGLLLSPFATARTPVRLWGDAILDPLGAALAVVGLGVILRGPFHSRDARMLVAMLAAVMLPGVVSGYDRPSLTRVTAIVVPLALLGAGGLEAVRRTFLGPRVTGSVAAALACTAIAVSGTVLFDVVNANVLASSSLGVALSRPRPEGLEVVVLDEMLWKPSYTRAVAEHVPPKPIRTIAPAALPDLLAAPEPTLVFWSPGEEEDYAVSATVCRARPDATLYELTDSTGFTRVFAAAPAGVSAWAERARDCTTGFDTETTVGERAIAHASALAREEKLGEAAEVLEAQARRTYGFARIFDAAARALLAAGRAEEDIGRAVEWASRACEASPQDDPLFCATLAEAHAAAGASHDAVRAARRAKDAAVRRGQNGLAAELELRIQAYVRAATGG